jgi:predicted RNase H-like HicB family nuclease
MREQLTMIVERDLESGWLIGEIVELAGCYTQAQDMPSLEAAIREAITVYLETAGSELPASEFVGTWRIDLPA